MQGRTALQPTRSALLWRFMVRFFARYLRRHLNALRLARWGLPDTGHHSGSIVVYSNHPSWWDALALPLIGEHCFPAHAHFAPFDARMLERYGLFRRLGAFPVDLDSRRGAVQFLAAARAVLARPERMLWITAQGAFRDVRARPLGLRPGVAHLAEIAPDALFLPLALDYAFWDERGAEACAAFGEPIPAAALLALPRPERLARLETALTATLDRLSADVIARDPGTFVPVVAGRAGVGGIYDLWRGLAARLKGRRFDPAHRIGNAGDAPVHEQHPSSHPRPHPEVPRSGLERGLQSPQPPLEGSPEARPRLAPQDGGESARSRSDGWSSATQAEAARAR